MRINPIIYAFLVLIVFLGVIFIFQSAGIWSTSGRQNSQGRTIQPDRTDTSTLKGWMTLDQISATYGVTLEQIIQAFNLPADISPDTAIKDLESETFSVSDLREWQENMTLSEQSLPLEELVPSTLTPFPTTSTPIFQKGQKEVHTSPDRIVNAQVTFQNLLDWGLTQETIEKVIGMPMPDASIPVKDYAIGQGLMFSEIKSLLQAEVDKLR